MLASGSDDKTIKLWSIENYSEITTLRGHSSMVSTVIFNNTGKILASGSFDNTIKLWDVESQTEIFTLWKHSDWIR